MKSATELLMTRFVGQLNDSPAQWTPYNHALGHLPSSSTTWDKSSGVPDEAVQAKRSRSRPFPKIGTTQEIFRPEVAIVGQSVKHPVLESSHQI